jgi:Wiskott-Aldrich syndrome protein
MGDARPDVALMPAPRPHHGWVELPRAPALAQVECRRSSPFPSLPLIPCPTLPLAPRGRTPPWQPPSGARAAAAVSDASSRHGRSCVRQRLRQPLLPPVRAPWTPCSQPECRCPEPGRHGRAPAAPRFLVSGLPPPEPTAPLRSPYHATPPELLASPFSPPQWTTAGASAGKPSAAVAAPPRASSGRAKGTS